MLKIELKEARGGRESKHYYYFPKRDQNNEGKVAEEAKGSLSEENCYYVISAYKV